MLPLSVASSRPPLPPCSGSKPDTYKNGRTRHPAGSHQHPAIGQSLSLTTPAIAYTSTSDFRNETRVSQTRSAPPARLRNVYKREENGKAPTANGLTIECPNGLDPSRLAYEPLADQGEYRKKGKRENMWLPKSLLRSSKPNAGGRQQHPSTLSFIQPSANNSMNADHSNSDNSTDTVRKSPLLSAGNPLAGLFERLRPRSGSDAVSTTLDLFSKRKKGFSLGRRQSIDSPVDTDTSPQLLKMLLNQRRVSTPLGSPSSDLDEEDQPWTTRLDDENSLSPVRRKRSTSDSARFLIMRKTSRPNTTEVMGCINRDELAHKQLLKKFTCYDLMPSKGALVVVDAQISTSQALISLAENGVRAALLWDSKQQIPLCLLTVTDFLRIIHSHFSTSSPVDEDNGILVKPQHVQAELSDVLDRPILANLIRARSAKGPESPKRCRLTSATADDKLLSVLTILRLNRLHRIPILEPETGNPLYLLSLKRILHFLHLHMNSLPRSKSMYKSLDELRVGTWMHSDKNISVPPTIVYLSPEDSMLDAVGKFLHSGASSLPVLHSECTNGLTRKCSSNAAQASIRTGRLIDVLTKVDLMHFVVVNSWNNLHEKRVEDVLNQREKGMEHLITCHRKTPLALAMDRLVSSQSHRIYIVDSEGSLQGVLSIGDLLSYLIDQPEDSVKMK